MIRNVSRLCQRSPPRGKITPSCELPAYPSVRWALQTLCGHRTTCCWAGRPSQPVPTDNASSTPITTTPSFPSISQTPRGRSTATVRASHPPGSLIRGGSQAECPDFSLGPSHHCLTGPCRDIWPIPAMARGAPVLQPCPHRPSCLSLPVPQGLVLLSAVSSASLPWNSSCVLGLQELSQPRCLLQGALPDRPLPCMAWASVSFQVSQPPRQHPPSTRFSPAPAPSLESGSKKLAWLRLRLTSILVASTEASSAHPIDWRRRLLRGRPGKPVGYGPGRGGTRNLVSLPGASAPSPTGLWEGGGWKRRGGIRISLPKSVYWGRAAAVQSGAGAEDKHGGGRGQKGPQSSSWHPPLEEPELPAPKVSLGRGAQGTDISQRHSELAFTSVLVSPQACPSLSKVRALQAGEGRGQHRERLQPPLPGHPSALDTPSRPLGAWLVGHLLSEVQGLEGVWGGAR